MSDNEFHKGKIVPIATDDPIKYLESLGIGAEDSDSSYDLYADYGIMLYNGKLYRVEDKQFEIYDTSYNKHNDVVEYNTGFYNGGTCLFEILQDIIEEQYGR